MVEPTPAQDRARADDAVHRLVDSEHRAAVAAARPGWHWWAVMIVTATVGPALAILIATWNQHRSEQAWCEVITVLDDGYRNPDPNSPPLSARGQRLRDGILGVGRKYGCLSGK